MKNNKLTTQNSLNKIIADHEYKFGGVWKPNRHFYQTVGIGQKRFGQILRNEVSPTIEETALLADFFNVNPTEIITYKTT